MAETVPQAIRRPAVVALTAVLGLLPAGGAPGQQVGGTPLGVGSQKQLFIDHKFIESKENISLCVNPPVKRREAVIHSDKPWDAFAVTFLSVAEDGGVYKMWYEAFDGDIWGGGARKTQLCYATSKNLLDWDKPNLGIVDYQGSRDNNILIENVFASAVFIDPHGKPQQRYKLLYSPAGADFRVATSPDGIHWEMPGTKVADFLAGDVPQVAFWDRRLNKYAVYFRPAARFPFVDFIQSDPPVVAPKVIRHGRQVARVEVDDILAPWPKEDARLVLTADEHDPEGSDIYTHFPYQYPYAADAYFMFPMTYQHFHSDETDVGNDGVNDVQFAASRDGIHWMRYDRKTYIQRGLLGEPDGGMMATEWGANLRRGNYLYHFYGGWPFTHGGFRRLSPQQRKESWGRKHVGLAVQRLLDR